MFNLNMLQSKKKNFLVAMIYKVNIKFLTTLICFLFIGTSIYVNFESLSNQEIATEEILWLLVGFVLSFISIIINAYAWQSLTKNIGCNIDKFDMVKLYLTTNLYKYFPGGIWHFVSRYNSLRLEFSTEKSIESIVLEPILMLVAGFIFIPLRGQNIFIFILCWSSTLVFLPAFRHFVIRKMKAMKSAIFTNNNRSKANYSLQNNQYILRSTFYPYKPLFIEILFILFRFLGFLCCMNAFSIGSLISQSELISYFSLAWIIGLVVPAAPGGFGVFESVILFTLGSFLPEAPLLASLLCYRLITTISDVCAALIYPVKRLFNV